MVQLMSVALRLEPPLFMAWKCFQGRRADAPLARNGLSLLSSANDSCLALDTSTGRQVWEYRSTLKNRGTGPLFLTGSEVAVYVNALPGKGDAKRIDFLSIETGGMVRSVDRGSRMNMEVVDNLVVSGSVRELECWSIQTGDKLWYLDFGRNLNQWMLDEPFYADSEVIVFGLQGGGVRCIRTRTAEPVWETSVADFRIGEHPDVVGGQMERFDSVLAIPMSGHTVGISIETGERLWVIDRRVLHGRPRSGDRLFMGLTDGWGWLDPRTGKFHSLPRLENPPGFLRFCGGGWLISSTHYFQALWGWIDAWDRDTGKLVWSGQATGGQGYLSRSPMTVADGRLYYRDSTYNTYCFEEIEPSDPVLKAERASGRSNPIPESVSSGVLKATAPRLSAISKKTAKTKTRSPSRAKTSKTVARRRRR